MRQLALLAMFLGTPVLSLAQTAQTPKTNESSWDALNTLRAGQRIEVFETNLKQHKGTFSTLTEEAIQLREDGSVCRFSLRFQVVVWTGTTVGRSADGGSA